MKQQKQMPDSNDYIALAALVVVVCVMLVLQYLVVS